MKDLRKIIDLIDLTESSKLSRVVVPYSKNALTPVISAAAFSFHYDKLYKKYVDNFNSGDNKSFNEAGAYLHGIYFSQLNKPSSTTPRGKILDLMLRHHDTVAEFKAAFKEQALAFKGSGWIYLSKSGAIKTIPNHAKRPDIALLVDLWEHSWMPDFHDKGKFLDSIWKIMDWNAINRKIS